MAQTGSLSSEMETLSHALSLVETFRAFDADNDGSITVAELGGLMSSLGYRLSENDVRAMMQQGDTNKDGLLSIEEFLEMNTKGMELGGIASFLKPAFEAFNVDGAGVHAVTAQELYDVIGNMGLELSQAECQEVVDSMDADGDGAVSFEDFKLIVNSLL